MASKPLKKVANRASLTRQSTSGPLDAGIDPLSHSVPTQISSPHSDSTMVSPATSSRQSPFRHTPKSLPPPSPSNYRFNPEDPVPQTKDLSFLLHPSFYLPISQTEVPPQFRTDLTPISASASLPELLVETDRLLSRGEFLAAAHTAAGALTSPALDSTDVKTIADLLSIRYSCLELTGNTQIAAQESKALEDLNSDFYYVVSPPPSFRESQLETTDDLPMHILPFRLRLQASRLQSIGFSDPRRGVSALYDLGLECRDHLSSSRTTTVEKQLWKQRLKELGMRVANALIEVNDLECAKRTLKDLQSSGDMDWKVRMGLMLLKVGDLPAAKELLDDSSETVAMLKPLLATAEGQFEGAVQGWDDLLTQTQEMHLVSIVRQNLAVNYLYAGRLNAARHMMESAVDQGEGHRSLTFNLATIYELSSEKSQELKKDLANKVASQDHAMLKGHGKMNADFKL
ncbi:hypothetical protein GJ744_007069 [Endocarpon pusillum]|uniref:Uncharacterized protein n=1 Tax=Endocarpon pusillum TaxID=364733 RepID=A0A8H7AS64_9EURO|nr:hypothetical protein GJ744_007069 [Endocarpon pusillum]